MEGVFFNEDSNHFIITRAMSGYEKITKEDNISFIDQYKNTSITDFLICLNGTIAFFKTERNESIYDLYKEIEKDKELYNEIDKTQHYLLKSYKLFCDMYDSGFDYRQIWIDRLRENGIHPWISIRTNDIHDCSNEKSLLLSKCYNENRDKLVGSHKGVYKDYYDYALDYSYDETRMLYLSMISEALDKYDVDGLELDFMREIYSFARGKEYVGKEIMNEFIHQVSALIWQAERERKHRIKLAVRVPSSIETAIHLGYDIIEWVNSGWVDHITISPRWATSDGDMNVELWHSLLKTKPVTLGCAVEILCNGTRKRTGYGNTKESVFGYAKAYSDLGADYIYLFNYMDAINDNNVDSIFEKNNYKEFLTSVGNPVLLEKCKKRHILTFNDVSSVGCPLKPTLPLELIDDEIKNFRILTGNTKNHFVRVVFGFVDLIECEDVILWINTIKYSIKPIDVKPKLPAPTNLNYYYTDFKSESDVPIYIGEIKCKTKAKIEWIEIDID